MSPRTQTVSDNEILEAAAKVVADVGPARLTLAEIARRVGLAAPTLVQRFGSKRGLLLALAECGTEVVARELEGIRTASASPLDAVRRLLLCFPGSIETPDALSNHLAFLQVDLNDPDFRKHAADHARAFHEELRRLIRAAVECGELDSCEPGRLARSLQAIAGGSMLAWAIEREGALVDWVRRDIDTVLRRFERSGR